MSVLRALSLSILATAAAAQPATRDWAALLRTDVAAFHAQHLANNPGPVNPDDPGYAARLDGARDRALARAGEVISAPGYTFALREMVASFNDGHVYIGFGDALPLPGRWPGFIASWRDDRLIVRDSSPGAPPMGAQVIDCDGERTAQLGVRLVGQWRGNWNLAAQREQHGWRVFYDQGNPYTRPPTACRFKIGNQTTKVTLAWAAEPADYFDRVERANADAPAAIGLSRFAGGGWIAAGSFNANPGSAQQPQLVALMQAVQADAPALRTAPKLVFDLRGNGGGSSDWSVQLANSIWGAPATLRARTALGRSSTVAWRASPANRAAIAEFCDTISANSSGSGPEAKAWCASIQPHFDTALAAGQALLVEDDLPPAGDPVGPALRTRPSYVLVDSSCASACLDAVDLFSALGAVVIGRTTSADSNYMEVRSVALPSGMGEFSLPMKVYRGRPRGSGVAVQPRHRFNGDMADRAALERWIMGLP